MCTDGDDLSFYVLIVAFVVLPIIEGRLFTAATSGKLADLVWFAASAAMTQYLAIVGATYVTRQVEYVVTLSHGWQLAVFHVLSPAAWVASRWLLYRHLTPDGRVVSHVPLRSVTSAAVGLGLFWLPPLVVWWDAWSP